MSSEVLSTLPKKLPSFFALFARSLSLYRTHAATVIGYAAWLLLPLAAHVVIRTTFGPTPTADVLDVIVHGILLALTVGIYNVLALSTPLFAAPAKGSEADRAADQEHARTYGWQLLMPMFVVMLLTSLAMTVGALLLVIPALIFATWFAFAPQTVLFENTRGVAALAASKRLVAGRFGAVFGRVIGFQVMLLIAYAVLFAAIFAVTRQTVTIETLLAPLPLPAEVLVSVFEAAVFPLIVIFDTLLYLALKNE